MPDYDKDEFHDVVDDQDEASLDLAPQDAPDEEDLLQAAADPLEGNPDEDDFFVPDEVEAVHNPNALNPTPAGPPPHPRSLNG